MAEFISTTGTDTFIGDGSDDLFIITAGGLQAADVFDGQGGSNTLRFATTTSLSNASFYNIDRIELTASNPAIYASKFGAGGISLSTHFVSLDVSYMSFTIDLTGVSNFDVSGFTYSGFTVQSFNYYASTANTMLIGSDGREVIYGSSGNDIFDGRAGDDFLSGDNGSDVLIGGAGADGLWGGGDNDYLFIDAQDTTVFGETGFDSVFVTTIAAVSLNMGGMSSIEWAQGNDGGDTFNAGNQTQKVYIYGMGGGDGIIGSGMFGDYLDGGDGDDIIIGGGGNDTLIGGNGADWLFGEAGSDRLYVTSDDTTVSGGSEFDYVYVTSATGITLDMASSEIEWVEGSDVGGDVLDATLNSVNTYFYGRGGADSMFGGAANDYLSGGDGDDMLTGARGNDTLYGDAGTDTYRYTLTTWGSDTIFGFDPTAEKLDFSLVAAIDDISDFTYAEWNAYGLGSNSTTLFYHNGVVSSAITLVGLEYAQLSNADFIFIT